MLFRLCSFSRDVKTLPKNLEEYVLVTGNKFAVPPLEELEKFRVVVSTCVSSGILQDGVGLPRGHFNYIFVDEAAQAHEPETMIPIQAMADDYTNVVVSGDPKQLPAVLRSSLARDLGLARSYLERMTNLATENSGAELT